MFTVFSAVLDCLAVCLFYSTVTEKVLTIIKGRGREEEGDYLLSNKSYCYLTAEVNHLSSCDKCFLSSSQAGKYIP